MTNGTFSRVTGVVTQKTGAFASGFIVRVFDRQVGARPQLLAEGTTDSEGRYQVEYRPRMATVNLLVQVYPPATEVGADAIASTLKPQAGTEEVINLQIDKELPAPSIFEKVDHALKDRMRSLPNPETLNAEDIRILAIETALETEQVQTYLKAHTLLKSVELADVLRQDVEVAYALAYLAGERPAEELVAARGPVTLKTELKRLATSKVLPSVITDKADNLVTALQQKYVERTLQQTEGFGGLLAATRLNRDQKAAVITLHLEQQGWSDPFWQALGQRRDFSPRAIAALKHTLELNRLTDGHLALVRSLQQQRRFNSSARELAKLTPDEWKVELRKAGETDEVKIATLTKQLSHRAEAAFPTTAIATGIRVYQDQKREPIRQFLEANESFDLNRSHVGDFLKRRGTREVPADTAQQAVLKHELDQIQRIFRIAPKEDRYSVMRVLLDQGYDSAYKIRQIPREVFVQAISAHLPEPTAATTQKSVAAVYERALAQANLALGAFSYGLDYKLLPVTKKRNASPLGEQTTSILGMTPWLQEPPDSEDYPTDDPDLFPKIAEYRELFGSVDFCKCEHWESVLGPAAYLVDLLKWLEKPSRNLLPGLVKPDRRPDIPQLLFTQANTETQLPHIDLVNEILEHAVVVGNGASTSALPSRNTSDDRTSEELLACPEHLDEAAYAILRDATNPNAAGLDLWAVQARAFLAQIKVERAELMAALRPDDPSLELDLALEALGLTPGEHAFLTGRDNGTFIDEWLNHERFVVRNFLRTTGLNYQQLLDLLYTESANPVRVLHVQHRVPQSGSASSDPCSLEQQELQQANGASPILGQYIRLHRFITLWRRVGWTMLELDKAIQSLRGNEYLYSDPLLQSLGQVMRLQRLTSLDVLTLLSWWAPIDNRDDRPDAQPKQPSLYERVFRSPVRALPGQKLPLLPSPDSIHNHRVAIATSLQIGMRDLNLLETKTLNTDPGEAPDPDLTLETLSPLHREVSLLHREVSLGKALGIPVRDVLTWRTLIPTDPFASPSNALKFIRQVQRCQEVGFSADEVLYLLAHDSEAAIRLGRDQKAIATVLWRLRQALRAMTPPQPVEQPLIKTAQEFVEDLDLNASQQAELLAILAGTSALPEAEQEQRLAAHFHEILVLDEAKEKLIQGGGTLADQARWEYVDTAVYRYSLANQKRPLRRSLRRALEDSSIDPATHDRILALAAAVPATDQVTETAELIASHLRGYLDLQEAKQCLLETNGLLGEARYGYLQAALDRYPLRQAELEKFLVETTKLHPRIIHDFLTRRVDDTGITVLNALLQVEFDLPGSESATPLVSGIDADLRPECLPDAFIALTRLDKLALLYDIRLEVDADVHAWLVDHAEEWELLDPLTFPWVPSPNPSALFAAWERLMNLLKLSKELPGRNPTLADLLKLAIQYNILILEMQRIIDLIKPYDPGWNPLLLLVLLQLQKQLAEETFPQLVTAISHRTGWSETEITVALTRLVGSTSLRGVHFCQLLSMMKVVSRLGVSVETALSWSSLNLSASQSHDIRKVVASHFDDRQWLQIATAKQNSLREQQRDALVAHLIINDSRRFQDEKDLYAYFLIDPEMSSCRQTSRIRQAISSVQLYVQRHLLGLEEKGTDGKTVFTEEDKQQWTWRKFYRLWEANRKVFLYPENWIRPELRKDKTELFKAFENELQQKDCTSDNAEQALANYVHQLGVLSDLELAGLYIDGQPPENIGELKNNLTHWHPHFQTSPTLHILSRTRTEPYRYYYRTCRLGQYDFLGQYDIGLEQWSSWQLVNVSINGEHVIPVVRWGRVFLFWITFSDAKVIKKYGDKIERDCRDIQLNYSELTNNGWQSPKSGKRIQECPNISYLEHLWFVPTENLDGCYSVRQLDENEIALSVINLGSDENPEIKSFFLPTKNGPIAQGKIGLISGGSYRRSHPLNSIAKYGRWRIDLDKNENALIIRIPSPYLDPGSDQNDWFTLLEQEVLRTSVYDNEGFGAVGPVSDNEDPGAVGRTSLTAWIVDSKGCPWHHSFGIWDRHYSFILTLDRISSVSGSVMPGSGYSSARYIARRLYHPFTDLFAQTIQLQGAKGLLAPTWNSGEFSRTQLSRQQIWEEPKWKHNLASGTIIPQPLLHEVDFTPGRPNTDYNWELFFHCPFLIAESLRRAHHFADAMAWFHYIFDPTNRDSWDTQAYSKYPTEDLNDIPVPLERRYWQFRPFLSNPGAPIQVSMRDVNKLISEITAWLASPFDPHAIARFRTSAYQKAVVMAYLNNLLDWGDDRFRQYTHESINEATQLYILAAEILGDRPAEVSRSGQRTASSYAGLESRGLDEFANVLVPLENLFPSDGAASGNSNTTPNSPDLALYFCIPPNPDLIEYWDEVEKQLFKIRHCLDIEGRERPLPLWDPPIDPALLVQAVAKGVDLDTVLRDLAAPPPHSRFSTIIQRAFSVTASVRSLGSALLTALEKRDAEDLALLRSELEQDLLAAILDVRQQQVSEASRAQQAIEASQRVVEERRSHYEQLIDNDLIQQEKDQKILLEEADRKRKISEIMEIIGAAMGALPDFSTGQSITPNAPPAPPQVSNNWSISFGGHNLAAIFSAIARGFTAEAASLNFQAEMRAIDASHIRRAQDWDLQLKLAEKEISQLNQQIAAAEVRVKIAEQERDNQQIQINNAQQIHEWMQRKYTNRELYDWMAGQLRTLYYQTYNLAFDLAKRAERCMTYELGLNPAEANFIDYSNWENDRKGLLAGERLQLQLEQLEAAYLDLNRREYELRKHVSLNLLDPMALLSFREQGKCFFTLPEVLFDLDLPGHYLRRLKSVSVSIPAVTGPYTTISATLTLVTSNIRRTPGGDLELEATAESIVISSANNDPGVFQLNHQDPRYLPFEGRGAFSSWKLELTESIPTFDRSTISDVILHLEYTAREGGEPYRSQVAKKVRKNLDTLKHDLGPDGIAQLIDIRRLFPSEWRRFTQKPDNSTNPPPPRELTLNLSIEQLPYMFRGLGVKVKRIGLLLKGNPEAQPTEPALATMGSAQTELTLTSIDGFLGGHLYAEGTLTTDPPAIEESPQEIAPLLITAPAVDMDAIKPKDAYLVLFYTVESQG